jgi:hypothetical protein
MSVHSGRTHSVRPIPTARAGARRAPLPDRSNFVRGQPDTNFRRVVPRSRRRPGGRSGGVPPPHLGIAKRGAVQAPSRGPLATMTIPGVRRPCRRSSLPGRHGRQRRLTKPASRPLGVATFCRAVSHGLQLSARRFHASMHRWMSSLRRLHASMHPWMSFVTATHADERVAHAFVPPLQASMRRSHPSMPPTHARRCPRDARERRWNITT